MIKAGEYYIDPTDVSFMEIKTGFPRYGDTTLRIVMKNGHEIGITDTSGYMDGVNVRDVQRRILKAFEDAQDSRHR